MQRSVRRTVPGSRHGLPGARHDRGASTLEYALLVAAVAAVLVAVLIGIGSIVKDAIDRSDECISSGGTSTSCPTR